MTADIQYFARIAGDNLFREWLEKEEATVIKTLRTAEGGTLFRAQGRAQLIQEIKDRLEKSKSLR